MNYNDKKITATRQIENILSSKGKIIRLSLKACVRCSICAESCFKYLNSGGDPTYSPAYKTINSIGLIYKKKGRLSGAEFEKIANLVWDKCALCMRCRCPVGIDIPALLASARSICRAAGISGDKRKEISD